MGQAEKSAKFKKIIRKNKEQRNSPDACEKLSFHKVNILPGAFRMT